MVQRPGLSTPTQRLRPNFWLVNQDPISRLSWQCQWKSNEELFPPPARKASEKVLEAWVHTPAQQEGGALPCPWGVSRSPQGNLGFHTNRGGTKQRHPSSASSVSEETRRNGKFQ